MTSSVPNDWELLCQGFARLSNRLDQVKTVNVNSSDLRGEVLQVAKRYLTFTRPILLEAAIEEDAKILDGAFSNLLQLSDGLNALSSYRKQVKRIRKAIPSITAKLAIHAGSRQGTPGREPSAEEKKLIATLRALVPSAALSYAQALADLNDEKRQSFRGPALEFREALRETLDHLAPDKDVMAAAGFQLEEKRTGPTTKQKVRFILRARGIGKSGRGAPEDTANAIDELIGQLTRTVQDLSSIATHVATERSNVRRVKRYIDAVLHDILELS